MIQINEVLCTRDGRKIGNGIVIGMVIPQTSGIIMYRIKTDFGNIVELAEWQIHTMFYIDYNSVHIYDAKSQFLVQVGLLYNNFKEWTK